MRSFNADLIHVAFQHSCLSIQIPIIYPFNRNHKNQCPLLASGISLQNESAPQKAKVEVEPTPVCL